MRVIASLHRRTAPTFERWRQLGSVTDMSPCPPRRGAARRSTPAPVAVVDRPANRPRRRRRSGRAANHRRRLPPPVEAPTGSPTSACRRASTTASPPLDSPSRSRSRPRRSPSPLAGRDVCGRARTGSGKTLAFGVPMLARIVEAAAPADRSASSSCPPASSPCRSPRCSSRSPTTRPAWSSPCTAAPAGRTRSTPCARVSRSSSPRRCA